MKYVEGDLCQSDAECLVNAVNCVGVMGAGLARAFREKFPAIMRPYIAACRSGALRPGKVQVLRLDAATGAVTPDGKLLIANLPTKDDWRKPSELAWVDDGLKDLAGKLSQLGVKSVAIPKLGTGLGGLPWPAVRDAIEKHFAPLAANGMEVLVFGEAREHAPQANAGRVPVEAAAPTRAPTAALSAAPLDDTALRRMLAALGPIMIRERDVLEFQGEDRCGSNMWRAPVLWGDAITPPRIFPCNELPYVLAKTLVPEERQRILDAYDAAEREKSGSGPFVIKKLGRGLTLRPDWVEVRVPTMQALEDDKYGRNPQCARWLIGTGNGRIQEGNRWGDTFWGVALVDIPKRNIRAGEGRNELGKCLVNTRDKLQRLYQAVRAEARDGAQQARRARGFER